MVKSGAKRRMEESIVGDYALNPNVFIYMTFQYVMNKFFIH
jgi:hypothetical protein